MAIRYGSLQLSVLSLFARAACAASQAEGHPPTRIGVQARTLAHPTFLKGNMACLRGNVPAALDCSAAEKEQA